MTQFKCYYCNYTSDKSYHIKRHFNRLKPCNLNITNQYTDEEIKFLNEAQFDRKMYKLIKNGQTKEVISMYKNKETLDNSSKNIDIQTNCKKIDKLTNVNIGNDQNNHTNITINIDKLVGFNKEWDTTHIDKFELLKIIFNPMQFSNFHKSILNNDNNNNIVINEDGKSGLVYINNDNGDNSYKKENIDNIMNNNMKKLYTQLKIIASLLRKEFDNEEMANFFDKTIIQIEQKYENFEKSSDIKKHVNHVLSNNLYNKNEISKQFLIEKNIKYPILDSGY